LAARYFGREPILEIDDRSFEVKIPPTVIHSGGEDFDMRICELLRMIQKDNGVTDPKQDGAQRLKESGREGPKIELFERKPRQRSTQPFISMGPKRLAALHMVDEADRSKLEQLVGGPDQSVRLKTALHAVERCGVFRIRDRRKSFLVAYDPHCHA